MFLDSILGKTVTVDVEAANPVTSTVVAKE
jgi:hypothetical protein